MLEGGREEVCGAGFAVFALMYSTLSRQPRSAMAAIKRIAEGGR